MESPDVDKDRLIQQQQAKIEELENKLKRYTNPQRNHNYYDNNREKILNQQKQYKRKVRESRKKQESGSVPTSKE